MALRLTGKFSSWSGELFYIEIYDEDLVSPATDEFSVVSASFKREGGDGTAFSRIFTGMFTVEMIVNTSATESFLADLADQSDRKFFVKVKRNYVEAVPPTPLDTYDNAFNGVLLPDDIRVNN